MTVVYLDAFLLLNLAINFLLLAAAGKLSGDPCHRGLCLLAAGLGAGFAALSLFEPFRFLEHPVCKAAMAVGMLLTAFGKSDRLLRTSALFLVLSCAFGGGILLLGMLGGAEDATAGVFTSPVGMRGILITAALSYGGLSLLLRGQFAHTRTADELRSLTLKRGENSVTLLALRDTGNTLRDPLTGRPVVVVEGEKLRPLLPELEGESFSDPVELLRRFGKGSLRLQLLPYRSIGVNCGLLLALRLDSVTFGRQAYRNCLTALSPTPVSDGGGYSALIGGQE